VASAGPLANHLQLHPDRQLRHYEYLTIQSFYRPSSRPTNRIKALKTDAKISHKYCTSITYYCIWAHQYHIQSLVVTGYTLFHLRPYNRTLFKKWKMNFISNGSHRIWLLLLLFVYEPIFLEVACIKLGPQERSLETAEAGSYNQPINSIKTLQN